MLRNIGHGELIKGSKILFVNMKRPLWKLNTFGRIILKGV
jgi:hypothetical protein